MWIMILRYGIALLFGIALGLGLLFYLRGGSDDRQGRDQDMLNQLIGKDITPYFEGSRLPCRDCTLLFIDPECAACEPVYALLPQRKESVFLAVDHPQSEDLDNYFVAFGINDFPVLYETMELRRDLPINYWPTAISLRGGRVTNAGNGSATVKGILTDTAPSLGGSPFSSKEAVPCCESSGAFISERSSH